MSDLIGCRYRLSLDLREGRLVEPASHHEHRLPMPIASVPGLYTAVSGPDAHLDTLEAIARGESAIAGAVLMHERLIPGRVHSGIDEICHPDLLVKVDDSPQTTSPIYMSILVATRHLLSACKQGWRRKPLSSNAVRAASIQVRLLGADRPGHDGVMGRTLRQAMVITDGWKLRYYGPDAVKLGQAVAMLHWLGVSCGPVGATSAIGMNLNIWHIVIVDEGSHVTSYRMALRDVRDAVAAAQGRLSRFMPRTWLLAPRRIQECRTCRHHGRCLDELTASDDISLLLPGGESMRLRSVSIDMVMAPAQASTNTPYINKEQMWMARARLADVDALRVTAKTSAPHGGVEMDIDMEAYPNDGAYLWGTQVSGEDYRGFITQESPGPEGFGGTAEARNFAILWDYLMRRRNAAHEQGKAFRAYCWTVEGENYRLRQSAIRFGGQEFVVLANSADLVAGDGAGPGSEAVGPTKIVRVPICKEVDKFIVSEDRMDMLKIICRQILSTVGMGLKIVAP